VSRPPLYPLFRVASPAAALALLASALAVPSSTRNDARPSTALDGGTPLEAVDAGVEAWAVDAAVDWEAVSIGAKAKAHPDQKKPPCVPRAEVEYDGVCWVPHAEHPPCPPAVFEAEGRCLVRVKASPRPPTSVAP
jgi:hypothetical protein